ncbi:TetR/AcrR family transcriptional regulator [Terriglobus saanensis]|uniref:Regulatory protein TetR n=1 Tax=Terriglobus saanensis (strain ATCC BAA-1853 / DSM 23119 / SP1PR4) TaxID=401053 RepID=E8V164_TERSS|nr:TetR/AcrR family transcriptional regulator [Terriglobus saanensis]ADV83412.1 regulatory protein TetR [Terriglobus saanensis SP1PR4]
MNQDSENPLVDFSDHGAKRQERSLLTRQTLITAARVIFARDGFEMARLEDIAAEAGKTRGAFYAHFENKEDVFFAIFEEDIYNDHSRLADLLSKASNFEERLEVFINKLMKILKDKRRMLLDIEFKLYAIRHPHKQKRLADLHAAMCYRCAGEEVDSLFSEVTGFSGGNKRREATQFGALLNGFALNELFDPMGMNEEQLRQHIRAALLTMIDLGMADRKGSLISSLGSRPS